MSHKIIILTDGQTNMYAKTAISVIRYRREEIVALFDRETAGRTSQELLSIGGDLPIIGSLDDAPEADTLMIGIAPPGGHIPAPWRPILLDAIGRGMTILSGLHDFLSEDPEFAPAAAESGAKLVDVRKSNERDVAAHDQFDESCLRILTVGNACSCGKWPSPSKPSVNYPSEVKTQSSSPPAKPASSLKETGVPSTPSSPISSLARPNGSSSPTSITTSSSLKAKERSSTAGIPELL